MNEFGGAYQVKGDFKGLTYEWKFKDLEAVIKRFPGGVGDGQCVALVKDLLEMPTTHYWFEDVSAPQVYGNPGLPAGTVIATFVGGVYQSLPHRNHAAIYVKQIPGGIVVIDQWFNPKTGKRQPPHYREIEANSSKSPSDNAGAFSVVRTSATKRR
jgi:hypothetical protein